MNYLAHIYLSGKHPLAQVGGFVADAVKGRSYERYPALMRDGILLHRRIDAFTDAHWLTRKWVILMQPYFGRYSAVLLDVYFDYLLASDFERLTGMQLRSFVCRFNLSALFYYRYLPQRIRRFIFHFVATNRLFRYRTTRGMRESLEIMVAYRGVVIDPVLAETFLLERYTLIRADFRQLWLELLAESGQPYSS